MKGIGAPVSDALRRANRAAHSEGKTSLRTEPSPSKSGLAEAGANRNGRPARRMASWFVALLFALGQIAIADGAPADRDSTPLGYRRIFVPASRPETWPDDDEKYLPVQAREFEELVAGANRAQDNRQPRASVPKATYFARFTGHELRDGRATWQIEVPGRAPALVELGDMSTLMANPVWRDDPTTPVRQGLWGDSHHAPLRAALEAPRSGTLEFAWTATCRTTDDGHAFSLPLPPSTETRLTLELPEGLRPVVDRGLVLASSDASPTRTWEIALARQNSATIRIVDMRGDRPSETPVATLGEETQYHVTERGVDIFATLAINVPTDYDKPISIPLPVGVRLLDAQLDGTALTWEVAGDGSSRNVMVLKIPDGAQRRSMRLALRAWQPIDLGESWILPVVRPTDMFWSFGNVLLTISPQLELRSLHSDDCRTSSVRSGARADDGVESWSFECYSPSAKVELVVGQRPDELNARIGTLLNVGESGITGRCESRLYVGQGNIHTLAAEVNSDWLVEAVETEPPGAIDSWLVADGPTGSRLELRMAQSLRADDEVSVVVSGRLRRGDLLEPLAMPVLHMLRWQGSRVDRELLRCDTSEPFTILASPSLPPLADGDLSDDDRALFENAAGGAVFDLGAALPDASIQVSSQRGNYTTDLRIDATLDDGATLRTSYEIICRPQGSPVEQLHVQFSEALAAKVEWIDVGSGEPVLAQRLDAQEATRAGLPAQGEIWRVSLRRPTLDPVTIRATTTSSVSRRASVPIVSAPESVRQSGRIAVQSQAENRAIVEARNLAAVPLPTVKPQVHSLPSPLRTLAAYRYEPAQTRDERSPPQLWISMPTESANANETYAASAKLQSHYAASGMSTHRAVYRIENCSDAALAFQLPDGVSGVRASVDGQWQTLGDVGASNELRLALAPHTRSATVAIEFQLPRTSLRSGARLRPSLPAVKFPLLFGEWMVLVPKDFELVGPDKSQLQASLANLGLFGPIADFLFAPHQALLGSTGAEPQAASNVGRSAPVPGEMQKSETDGTTPDGALPIEGWQSYRTTFVAGALPSLTVIHRSTIRTWSMAAFLAAIFVGTRLKNWPILFIAFLALAASAGLLLAIPFAPVAVGGCLGLMLSLVVPARPQGWSDSGSTILTRPSSSILTTSAVLLLALVSLANSHAAELNSAPVGQPRQANAPSENAPSENAPTNAQEIEQILIPVDEQRRVVGDKYFVSEKLLQSLLMRERQRSETSFDWLIHDASVHGELAVDANQAPSEPGTWTLALRLEVFARDAVVALPLPSREADGPATVLLDGIPVPLERDEENAALRFVVREPGLYEAALAFVPRPTSHAGRRQFALAVPRIDGARVSIAASPESGDLRVEGATAHPTDDGQQSYSGALDGSGTLRVSWAEPTAPSPSGAAPRVDELRWLRVGDADVTLAAKYIINDSAANIRSLTILVDKQWKVLSPADSLDASGENDASAVDRVVEVPLKSIEHDGGSRLEAEMLLQLRDAPSIGQLRLPRLELTTFAPGTYRLAVSGHPRIECQVLGTGAWAPGVVQDFLTSWGAASNSDVPQLLLSEVSPRALLNVAARPRAVEPTVEEVLHIAATRDGLRLKYQGDIDPKQQSQFQCSLDVDPQTIVEEVLASRGGSVVGLRWVRATDRRVNVFFEDAVSEPYRLVLVGRVARNANETYPMPHVTTNASGAAARQIQLYREESVLVGLTPPQTIERTSELPPIEWNARWLGGFRLSDRQTQQARLAISPNEVLVRGQALSSLEPAEVGWQVVYSCRATVERGELSVLRFRAPSTWGGAYQASAKVPVDVSAAPYDNDEVIVSARFANDVVAGESVELSIRAPLAHGSASTLVVPAISLETPSSEWQSYVAVPARVEGKLASWSQGGVSPTELPESLRDAQGTKQIEQVFQVVAMPFRVALDARPADGATAGVRVADTQIVASDEGHALETSFVLDARALTQCTLQLPRGDELIEVRLDGHPAMTRPLGAQRWSVELGPPNLPQVLDVTSRSRSEDAPGGKRKWQRPELLVGERSIPVELSLWTVAWAGGLAGRQVGLVGRTSELEQAALRLDRLTSIVETAIAGATQPADAAGFDWFYPWAKRLASTRDRCQKLLASGTLTRGAQQVSASSIDQIRACEARIDKLFALARERWPKVSSELWSSIASPTAESDERFSLPDNDVKRLHVVEAGGDSELSIDFGAERLSSNQSRAIGLLAIALAAAVSIGIASWPPARDALWRWSHALGVLVGLAWWAWLTPSWLGWVIVAASLLLVLRKGRQESSER